MLTALNYNLTGNGHPPTTTYHSIMHFILTKNGHHYEPGEMQKLYSLMILFPQHLLLFGHDLAPETEDRLLTTIIIISITTYSNFIGLIYLGHNGSKVNSYQLSGSINNDGV